MKLVLPSAGNVVYVKKRANLKPLAKIEDSIKFIQINVLIAVSAV